MTTIKPSIASDNNFILIAAPAATTLISVIVFINLSWSELLISEGLIYIYYFVLILMVIWTFVIGIIYYKQHKLIAYISESEINFVRNSFFRKNITNINMRTIIKIVKSEYYGLIRKNYGQSHFMFPFYSSFFNIPYQYFEFKFIKKDGNLETVQLIGWDPATVNKLFGYLNNNFQNIRFEVSQSKESPSQV